MVPRETSMDHAEDAKQADETDSSDSPRKSDGDVAEKTGNGYTTNSLRKAI